MEKNFSSKKDNLKNRKTALNTQKDDSQVRSSVSAAIVEPPRTENASAQGEQAIEDAKFYMGQQQWPVPMMPRDLPAGYGESRIVLMVVDPWWAHTYWEVTRERIDEGLKFLGTTAEATKTILRVYDVTGFEGSEQHNRYFDIELKGMSSNWYINVDSPDRSFRVDIGLLTSDGRFFVLARSNTVTMPRASMSNVIDERWMSLDSEKMYALSGGFKIGSGSLELKEMMEKRFQESLSSGAVSSFGGSPVKKQEKKRSFWFVLDTELIVYGATEPDAQVTVGGRPIQLRPDGTFTLRYALPDGRFPIPATARSSDGKEERTITPVVQRNTEVSQPVLRP